MASKPTGAATEANSDPIGPIWHALPLDAMWSHHCAAVELLPGALARRDRAEVRVLAARCYFGVPADLRRQTWTTILEVSAALRQRSPVERAATALTLAAPCHELAR